MKNFLTFKYNRETSCIRVDAFFMNQNKSIDIFMMNNNKIIKNMTKVYPHDPSSTLYMKTEECPEWMGMIFDRDPLVKESIEKAHEVNKIHLLLHSQNYISGKMTRCSYQIVCSDDLDKFGDHLLSRCGGVSRMMNGINITVFEMIVRTNSCIPEMQKYLSHNSYLNEFIKWCVLH